MKDAIYEMKKLNLASSSHQTAVATVADKEANNNLLKNPAFNTFNGWMETVCNYDIVIVQRDPLRKDGSEDGKKVLCLWSIGSWRMNSGVYQLTNILPVGEYTLSANVRIEKEYDGMDNCGVFLRISDVSGNLLAESEHVAKSSTEYTPLSVTASLSEDRAVVVGIYTNGAGKTYVDDMCFKRMGDVLR